MAITFKDIVNANKLIETVDIKGKEYAEVHQRIKAFRSVFPEGFIHTEMVSNENGVCIFQAKVGFFNDDRGLFYTLGTGTAYEKESGSFINKTSYIENCETSAVGRALGMAGFGVDKSIASAEEVANAILNQSVDTKKTAKKEAAKPVFKGGFMDEAKLKDLLELAAALNWTEQYLVSAISKKFGKQPAELTESEYHKIVQGMTGEIANGKAE